MVTPINYRARGDCLMAKAAVHFDAQTIALLKVALDEAWDRLPPKLQATMLKTTLAERILKSAAEGERDRERLREAALGGPCCIAATKRASITSTGGKTGDSI